MGADEEDEQGFVAAEVVAADDLVADDVGEREVGRDGAEREHGGFGEGHDFSPLAVLAELAG